jgi:hypothetical protein
MEWLLRLPPESPGFIGSGEISVPDRCAARLVGESGGEEVRPVSGSVERWCRLSGG